MSEIRQSAGKCAVAVDMDGWPHWCVVNFGVLVAGGLTPADLHDLRYCIDRVLAQIPEGRK